MVETALQDSEWVCLGREVMLEHKRVWSLDNPGGLKEENGVADFNFVYPLNLRSLDETKIIRICEETHCSVVYHEGEQALYLALCDTGRDRSQNIALAYMIAYAKDDQEYGRIPSQILFEVFRLGPLSVSKEQYTAICQKLAEGLRRQKQRCEDELASLCLTLPNGIDRKL